MPPQTQNFDLSSILVIFLTLVVATYSFRVYSHPLRDVPGPLLAKFTNLRFLYHAWKGDLHLDHVRCHQKYGCLRSLPEESRRVNTFLGPVYRCAPNRVVFNSLTAANGAYQSSPVNLPVTNYPITSNLLH